MIFSPSTVMEKLHQALFPATSLAAIETISEPRENSLPDLWLDDTMKSLSSLSRISFQCTKVDDLPGATQVEMISGQFWKTGGATSSANKHNTIILTSN